MSKKAKSDFKKSSELPTIQYGILDSNPVLQYTRMPRRNHELAAILEAVNVELENAYQLVRSLPFGDMEEEEILQAVREMEDHRFALLSQLHDNRIEEYRQV